MRREPQPEEKRRAAEPSTNTLAAPVFIPSSDRATDFALALGWPMAASYPQQKGSAQSRYPLHLHYFGLRTDLDSTQIHRQLSEKLPSHWFTFDLSRLRAMDNPHAAMAFACVRLSFYVHSARLLDWLDNPLCQKILHLNAVRAIECFDGWQRFAAAFAAGRTQWLASGRSDVLGKAANTEQVQQWLIQKDHPWASLPWPSTPPPFVG